MSVLWRFGSFLRERQRWVHRAAGGVASDAARWRGLDVRAPRNTESFCRTCSGLGRARTRRSTRTTSRASWTTGCTGRASTRLDQLVDRASRNGALTVGTRGHLAGGRAAFAGDDRELQNEPGPAAAADPGRAEQQDRGGGHRAAQRDEHHGGVGTLRVTVHNIEGIRGPTGRRSRRTST